MSDFENELSLVEQIKNLSENDKQLFVDIFKDNLKEKARLERKRQDHKLLIRSASIFFGSLLAGCSLLLAAHAINLKASLLELAAVFTPIAGIAGVFIWGFQRKD
jgi:hypothetical protein